MSKIISLYEAEKRRKRMKDFISDSMKMNNNQLSISSSYIYIPYLSIYLRTGYLMDKKENVMIICDSEDLINIEVFYKSNLIQLVYEYMSGTMTEKQIESLNCYFNAA